MGVRQGAAGPNARHNVSRFILVLWPRTAFSLHCESFSLSRCLRKEPPGGVLNDLDGAQPAREAKVAVFHGLPRTSARQAQYLGYPRPVSTALERLLQSVEDHAEPQQVKRSRASTQEPWLSARHRISSHLIASHRIASHCISSHLISPHLTCPSASPGCASLRSLASGTRAIGPRADGPQAAATAVAAAAAERGPPLQTFRTIAG